VRASRRTVLRLGAGSITATLFACASPNPALYTIAPVPGAAFEGGPRVILLHEVVVANYLGRSQIVRSSENYRLDVMSNDWWGEPLTRMLTRVLAEELGQRLPRSQVYTDSGGISVEPDATVETNVTRLDENAAGALVMEAQVGVEFKRRSGTATRSFRFEVPPPVRSTTGEVAAISTALGRLADGVSALLVMPPGRR
jgi:uncharacterized lipoprotein YmbA